MTLRVEASAVTEICWHRAPEGVEGTHEAVSEKHSRERPCRLAMVGWAVLPRRNHWSLDVQSALQVFRSPTAA
jgi:hypothetical protein